MLPTSFFIVTVTVTVSVSVSMCVSGGSMARATGCAGVGAASLLPLCPDAGSLLLSASLFFLVVLVDMCGFGLLLSPPLLEVGRHGILQIIACVVVVRLLCWSSAAADEELLRCGIEALDLCFDQVGLFVSHLGGLVARHVIHSQRPPQHLGSIEVVYSQHRRPLILIHEEAKAAMLALATFGLRLGVAGRTATWIMVLGCILVAGRVGLGTREVDINNLAILGKDGDDIAVGEVVMEAADEDVGRVAVLLVPRGGGIIDGNV